MQCRDETAKARTMQADRLIHQKQELEREYHEEYHEVEAGIIAEGFVYWAIPKMKKKKKQQQSLSSYSYTIP